MAGRILIIRGGAIGDFILTLPAIQLLHQTFPDAHIEILGYRHIATLAKGYTAATRSIEYAGLAGFFNPKSELDPELRTYFAGFNQVISYLYDPDGFFEGNLRRSGVKNFIAGNSRLNENAHASHQLAEPLTKLGIYGNESLPVPSIIISPSDHLTANELLKEIPTPRIALHPGSGGARKTWPVTRWIEWVSLFLKQHPTWRIVLSGGECDAEIMRTLKSQPFAEKLHFFENLDLSVLAAVYQQCQGYLGQDSGISHLAAAVGCRSVLLFGPTDPRIWAPMGEHIQIVKSPTPAMHDIPLAEVTNQIESFIIRRTP
ncbi:MAG: glycosyltransferase family 9 protein [Chthoniobacterales bacterium]